MIILATEALEQELKQEPKQEPKQELKQELKQMHSNKATKTHTSWWRRVTTKTVRP